MIRRRIREYVLICVHVGFVLRHGYLCKSIEDEQHHKKLSCVDLKGRDRIIAGTIVVVLMIDIVI